MLKKAFAISLALVALVLCFAPDAKAGAWTLPKGDLQLISSVSYYSSTRYYNSFGKKRSQPSYSRTEASQYAEYGLTDFATIGGRAAFSTVRQKDTLGDGYWRSNLGDTDLFSRLRFWKNPKSVASVQLNLTLPSPDSANDFPKVGSDHIAGALRAQFGHNFSFAGRNHYADVAVGYRARAGRPGNQLLLEATAGLQLSDKWQLVPQMFVVRNQERVSGRPFTFSSADDYDSATLQLSAKYEFSKKHAVQLSAFRSIHGKNSGAGNGVMLSFVQNFHCLPTC